MKELGHRLSKQATEQHCWHQTCAAPGDLSVCQGCLTAFYCCERCRLEAWDAGHREECPHLATTMMRDCVFPVVPEEGEREALGRVTRLEKKLEKEKKDYGDLGQELKKMSAKHMESAENLKTAKKENEELMERIKSLLRAKGGDKCVISKMKKKDDTEENETTKEETIAKKKKLVQTDITVEQEDGISLLKPSKVPGFKHIKVFDSKELRRSIVRSNDDQEKQAYGQQVLVSLPTQKSENSKVSDRTVRARGHMALEVLKLLSMGGQAVEGEQVEQELKSLITMLLTMEQKLFLETVKKNSKFLAQVTKLTAEQSSRMMHAMGITYSQKRKMATVLGKMNGFNPFCGEKRQREYEKEAKYLLDKSKVEKGAMLLMKTATATHATMCPYVKITGLDKLVSDLVVLARKETPEENLWQSDPLSMVDLDNPRWG